MEIIEEPKQESTAGSDIRAALAISKTPPEIAAQNIDRAQLFEVNPDQYASVKDQLDPEAHAIERVPATIEPQTEKYLREGEQNVSLASNDIAKLNAFERRAKYYDQKINDIPNLQREINEIISKKMDSPNGVIEEGDEAALQDMNAQLREMNVSAEQYGIGGAEEFAVDVLSAGKDLLKSYWENKEILAGSIGAGAVVGGGIGLATPIPGATLVGLQAGLVKGAIGGTALVGFIDGYQQTSRSLYNELSQATNDQGEPLNIPHERMVNVSQGVGVLSGIASGLAGKVFASNNAFMKRFMSPKLASKFVMNPAVMAKMDILGGIAKSALSEGGEEAFQEFVQTVGSNFGKMDESEASFMNALDASLTSENLKKYAYSGAVGMGTSGLIQTVTSAPAYPGLKKRLEEVNYVTERKKEVLEAQNNMLELAEDVKATKMNELSPPQMNKFQKMVFGSLGVDENVWVTLEDMREFANSPEKAQAVRKVIDPKGELTKMAQELNTPLQIPKADFMSVVTEFPEVTDYMRLTPEGENPLAVRNEGKEFASRLDEAEANRAKKIAELGALPMTPEMEEQLKKDLNETVKYSKYFTDREAYLGQAAIQPTEFTNEKGEVQTIVSQKDIDDLNSSVLEARKAIDESMVAPIDKRFDRLEDQQLRTENEQEIQIEIKRLDKELSVVEAFNRRKPVEFSDIDKEIVGRHAKKGYSPLAIDPKTLPEDLKAIYLEHPELKRRKAFVEGGIDIEEAAILNGLENGEQLLKILAETPTRKQIEETIKNKPALLDFGQRAEISARAEQFRLAARDDAFTKLTRSHLKEMEFMRMKEWPTLKRGLIKIAKKAPTIEALNERANTTVSKMKIRDINPNAFKQGEGRSQKAAVEHFVKGEFEQAFDAKEKAALNNEMRKEATKALDKVEKYQKFWKRASSESNIQALKDAGMFDAMEEYMSLYKLDGAPRGELEQKKFNEFIKKQVDLGNFVPVVPERLDNTQASYKDLTVEQYQMITEMGEYMLHLANRKNKVEAARSERLELLTQETISEEIDKLAKANPNFDPERAKKKNTNYLNPLETFKEGVKTSMSTVASLKTVIAELDEYKLDGYFHRLIGKPIKEARTAKRMEIREMEIHDKDIIEKVYGMENFKKMVNEFIFVPEFKNIPTIGDGEGNIRKIDLLVLQAYMGDPDGKASIVNFVNEDGVSLKTEQVEKVLNTHLDEKDAAFVQNFLVDRFKRFEQRSFDLHKKTTGVEPSMVKGVPVVHKDKVHPGGYYPIARQMLPDEVRAGNFLADLQDKVSTLGVPEESEFYARMRTAEMTQQGRLKDRTGSKRPLDLSFENVFSFTEEAVHDLHFREVGIETLKVLKNPFNVKNMKAVVGPKKFVNLLNSVKDVVSKTTERESTLFGDEQKLFNNIIAKVHSLQAVRTIGANVTSAAIQADSLSNLMLRVGPKAGVYLGKTAAKMMVNISHYDHYVRLAEEINSDIKLEQDSIDHSITKRSYDWIPASYGFFKNYKKFGEGYNKFREVQQKVIDASFTLVRESDKFNKVLMSHAIGEMFLNGDVDGYPMSRLEKMSDTEKAEAMKSVIQQSSDLALTAAAPEDRTPLEKNKVANLFVRYWTDRRSRLNSVLAQIDKTKGSIRKGDNAKAAQHVLTLSLAMGSSAAFVNLIRHNEESILKKLMEVDDQEEAEELAISTAWGFMKAPLDLTLDTIPIIDNTKYQAELDIRSDYRNVSSPFFGVLSDFAAGIVIVDDALEMALKGQGKELNDTQRKILLTNAGYMMGGAPTNAMYKAFEALSSGKVKKGSKFMVKEIKDLHQKIDKYIDTFKDEPEAQEFIEDLKTYKKELPQFDADVKNIIPENTKETLKKALSGGEWNKFNKDTGAAGIYQFTEKRWEEIRVSDPTLGLTENGRVAKDPSQQERAMSWEIQDNTRGLLTYEIPITEENLLGAHEFGFDNFIALYESKDNEKLTVALGKQANDPVFKNFKTVGDVKRYLSRQVKS